MVMKIIRILLVLALALALPLRGYAAAGYMACSHSHGTDTVAAAHDHGSHDHGGHGGHGGHGHADHGQPVPATDAGSAGAANDATDGDPAASTCSVCCAGCAVALFDARPHGPVLDDPIASLLPVDVTRYASVVGDNPQRPPAIA